MHVQPPLLKNEMVTLFTNTFKSPYYEYLIGSSAQHFYDVVVIAERIKYGIRADRILEPTKKKWFTRGKMDAEVSNIKIGYKGKKDFQPKAIIAKATKPRLLKYLISTLLILF